MSNDPSDLVLRVDHLAKRYGEGAGVHDVSFAVRRGAISGFIGVNGAGKSTTIKCILGLTEPDAGAIDLFGAPASPASRRRLGFLPEERGLAPNEGVRDVVAFHARLKGMGRRDALRRADALLERIGLGGRRGARVEELSKGNAQRVQILTALAHAPDLLILDEPLTGLDPIGQSEVLALFKEFTAGGGAILFSTHAMAAAQKACDEVVMISGGCTVFAGSTAEASDAAPHGAVVVTADADGLARAAASVGGRTERLSGSIGDAGRWRVLLPAATPHPALVRALAEHAVPFHAFEPIQSDLEGAFWHLSRREAADEAPLRAVA